MTPFDLLRQIGNVDDKYIPDGTTRKRKKSYFPALMAAVVALAIIGTGAKYLTRMGSNVDGSAYVDSIAAGEAPTEGTDEDASPEDIPEAAAPPADTGTQAPPPVSAYDVTLLAPAQYPESIAYDDYDASRDRWVNNQVSDETHYAMNLFSYKTAAKLLCGTEKSGCYSPLSLYHTLSILASGAEGDTRQQILSLLGIGDMDTLASENGKLYRVNYMDDEINVLKIHNSLWLDETASDGTPVSYNQDWVMSAATDYYADVYAAEFSEADTSRAMGAWIAEKTGGMLSPELNLPEDTVMALVNTLWYKSQWMNQFNEEKTTSDTFYCDSGETVTVDFMHQTDFVTGSYVRGEGYTKSYLPLDQGRMIFVLPDEGYDIDDLLNEDTLWKIFEEGEYQSAEVHWSVPKFETNASYDLIPAMEQLGVTDAFDLVRADFSAMATSELPLYLGLLQQDTHITLSENGVEAAAYTIAEGLAGEGMEQEHTVIEMNLNRPFLYLITADDGSTLFMGVVRHPLQ